MENCKKFKWKIIRNLIIGGHSKVSWVQVNMVTTEVFLCYGLSLLQDLESSSSMTLKEFQEDNSKNW